jgi:hypothetical protein
MEKTVMEIDLKIKSITKLIQAANKIRFDNIPATLSDDFAEFIECQKRDIDKFRTQNSQELITLTIQHPLYQRYLKNVPGIDIGMSGFLIGLIDIEKCENLEGLIKYAGFGDENNPKAHCNLLLKEKLKTLATKLCFEDSPFAMYYWSELLHLINEHLKRGDEVYEDGKPGISDTTMIKIYTKAKSFIIKFFLANYWCAAKKICYDTEDDIKNYLSIDLTLVGQNFFTSWKDFCDKTQEEIDSNIIIGARKVKCIKEKIDVIFKAHGRSLPKRKEDFEEGDNEN